MGFFSLTLQVQYPVDLATVLTLLPPFGRSGLSAQSAPTRQQVEMQTPNVIQPDPGQTPTRLACMAARRPGLERSKTGSASHRVSQVNKHL